MFYCFRLYIIYTAILHRENYPGISGEAPTPAKRSELLYHQFGSMDENSSAGMTGKSHMGSALPAEGRTGNLYFKELSERNKNFSNGAGKI
jgi:hypothetical protein